MAPTPSAVGGLLRQVIHYHLDNASYDSALFFAERYTAQDPRSSEASHLYAVCHLRLGDYRSAYDAGKTMGFRGIHLGCSWVFAQACLALERYKDGINALEKAKGIWSQRNSMGKHNATSRAGLPDAAAVFCLLAKLYRGYEDKMKAIYCFEEALKANPFMWEAFKALCDLGVNVRVPNIFRYSENLLQGFDLDSLAPSEPAQGGAGPLDAIPKKAFARNHNIDFGLDPFSVNGPLESIPPNVEVLSEVPQSDFMTKIQAAKSRFAASTNGQSGADIIDTPAGALSEAVLSRASQEPPQAPLRRARTTHHVEMGSDAPPRMNYRLGTRKHVRPEEKSQEGLEISDASNASSGLVRPAMHPTERKRTVSGHPVPRSTISDEPAARRSARLNMFKPSSKVNTGAATVGVSAGRELKKARPQISRIVRPGSSASNVGRVVSGNRKPIDDQADMDHGEMSRVREPAPGTSAAPSATTQSSKSSESESVKQEEALRWILDLMRKLGNGYYLLSRFQCQEAIQALSSLPMSQQSSPWVLAQLGRAHYEQASYPEAEKFLRRMRVLAPSRLEDMEMYSTVLWHLKRETDLSFLAHELLDSSWHSPQAWCALGNAWSLARDPEQALRCFKRATQLDPKFAYAFTLQGHEHFANEEYEKAITAYRQAIAADKRHYNAYYGIGRVQERLGSYDKAYTHFHAAQTINPNNAVLITCIGNVLERQKQIMPALQAYTKAAELAPRVAQTRYKKAKALLALGQIEAAQKELMVLKDLAPEEGSVHFILGTLYRSMDEKQLAVRHFTIALALDPKAGPKIKEAIESFEGDIQMDDSMMA